MSEVRDSEDERCTHPECNDPLGTDPARDVLSGAKYCSFACLLDDSRDVFELQEGEA